MSGEKIIKGLMEAVEHVRNTVGPDSDYDFIRPLPDPYPPGKKGIQCGECGMKFDYGVSYGYACGNNRCPIHPRSL